MTYNFEVDEVPPLVEKLQEQLMTLRERLRTAQGQLSDAHIQLDDYKNQVISLKADNRRLEAMLWEKETE